LRLFVIVCARLQSTATGFKNTVSRYGVHLKVPAVTRCDVEEFRDKLSRGTATRTIAFLGALFTFAVKRGLRPDNPVRRVETYAIQHRQRRMTDAEYAALGKAISAMLSSWPMAPWRQRSFWRSQAGAVVRH
jgi:site-specific recombinase XerD